MKSNAMLDEIRSSRDAAMVACGGDLKRLLERYRSGENQWAAAGHPIVSLIRLPRVEVPLPDWEKLDAPPENEIIAEIRATRRRMQDEAAVPAGAQEAGTDHLIGSPADEIEEPNSGILREDPPEP